MEGYKKDLTCKMDKYVHFVYKISRQFPKEELYGAVSQFRRATLSIILNYIEGYARKKIKSQLNFFETSYGSLKESKYLLYFSFIEKYLTQAEYHIGLNLIEEIGAMLWTEISSLEKSIKNSDKYN